MVRSYFSFFWRLVFPVYFHFHYAPLSYRTNKKGFKITLAVDFFYFPFWRLSSASLRSRSLVFFCSSRLGLWAKTRVELCCHHLTLRRLFQAGRRWRRRPARRTREYSPLSYCTTRLPSLIKTANVLVTWARSRARQRNTSQPGTSLRRHRRVSARSLFLAIPAVRSKFRVPFDVGIRQCSLHCNATHRHSFSEGSRAARGSS